MMVRVGKATSVEIYDDLGEKIATLSMVGHSKTSRIEISLTVHHGQISADRSFVLEDVNRSVLSIMQGD